MPIPDIDTDYLLTVLSTLLNTPSPTGLCPGSDRSYRGGPAPVPRPGAAPHAQRRSGGNLAR